MSRFRRAMVLWLLALCLGGTVLAGCHTVRGAGKDIESAGEGIQRATE
jgi:predicted small secreted protein